MRPVIRNKNRMATAVSDKPPQAHCNICPLKNQPYVPTEAGTRNDLAIIGIAPHTQEVRKGVPFIGPSGQVLDGALESIDLNRKEITITNLVCCKPIYGTDPPLKAIACCMSRLDHDLSNVEKIICMGNLAKDALLPDAKGQTMQESRGLWFKSRYEGISGIATYHPSFVLRGNESAYLDIINDLDKANDEVFFAEETDYVVLKTHDQLADMIKDLQTFDGIISLDLETSNENMKDSTPEIWWQGYILCCGLSKEPGFVYVISEELFNDSESLNMLKPIFERAQGFTGHNLTYDVMYLQKYYDKQLKIKISEDTFLMNICLDERKGVHSLTSNHLSGYYFNEPDYDESLKIHLKRKTKDSYSLIPRKELYKYMAKDVDYSLKLMPILRQALIDSDFYEYPYKNVIMKSLPTMIKTELRGLQVFAEDLENVRVFMAEKVDILRQSLRQISEKPDLNPNSYGQVGDVMFDDLGFRPIRVKGVKTKRSTGKEVLLAYQDKHPFVSTLIEYRRWHKLLSTYANKIPNHCDETNTIRFRYNYNGTVTGRLSAGLLLTMPRAYTDEGKMIRTSMGAREGYVLVDADYSQSELRWFGWYAQEPFLIEVYSRENSDLHSEVARAMYGNDFTKEQRTFTKNYNFEYIYTYQGSVYNFVKATGISIEEATAYARKYDQNMPRAAQWKKDQITRLKKIGFLRSALGRVRRYPIINSNNIEDIRNSAINFPVQSISSDVTLLAYCLATEEFERDNIPAYPVLFLHDGIYFETLEDKDVIGHVTKRVQEIMIQVAKDTMEFASKTYGEFKDFTPVRVEADVKVTRRWGGERIGRKTQ